MKADRDSWDAIIVGSGIGGLACAAALARTGYAVCVGGGTALRLELTKAVVDRLWLAFHRNGPNNCDELAHEQSQLSPLLPTSPKGKRVG